MEKIEIDTYFGDKPHHVEIAAPMGIGGATYYVIINNFYNGSMIKTTTYGSQIHLHPTTLLQGDDVTVMIDLIFDMRDLGEVFLHAEGD